MVSILHKEPGCKVEKHDEHDVGVIGAEEQRLVEVNKAWYAEYFPGANLRSEDCS